MKNLLLLLLVMVVLATALVGCVSKKACQNRVDFALNQCPGYRYKNLADANEAKAKAYKHLNDDCQSVLNSEHLDATMNK